MSTEIDASHISISKDQSQDSITKISNMLELSKQERDSIKAQMFDATKRLTELDGIIAALQRTVDLMKGE